MTLIELLAASALAALLMVSIMGVFRSLARQRKAVLDNRPDMAWRQRLLEQFRFDLANAGRLSVQPEEVHMVGYGGRDFSSAAITHRPTEVVYFLRQQAGKDWLLRQEIHLDGKTLENSHTELVCEGITAVSLRHYGDAAEVPSKSERAAHATMPPSFAAVPDKMQLTLYGQTPSKPILDEAIFLH